MISNEKLSLSLSFYFLNTSNEKFTNGYDTLLIYGEGFAVQILLTERGKALVQPIPCYRRSGASSIVAG